MHILHSLTLTYLTEIRNQRTLSNSTDELSYRDFLGKFLRGAADALGRKASFTGEAKKITFGRPDYEVTHGLKVVGYVEAEALGTPLAQLKGSAKTQNARFRENLHNFLLTNHTEFRLFVGGKETAHSALLPEPPEHGAVKVSDAVLDSLQALLETFLDTATPAAVTPQAIAGQLARRARDLRFAADAMLSHEESPLHSLWSLYKLTLFEGITAEKFADVYAQTFTYGLFLAWLNTDKKPFDRPTALSAIPRAVPPIRVLVQFGGGDDLPEELHWIVNGICSDLDAADKEAATKHPAGIADPLVFFYETFLSAYDPALRERAGVYYTPDPVVDFLVRAVDNLLISDFQKPEGLADESVRLLDPATGTATFLARAYRQVHQTMTERGDGGVWPDRARTHLAKHFYGFERLPAAYTLAHVKLRQQLAELGVILSDTERLPVYLADTMMNRVPDQMPFPGADILSKEIRDASHVRDQERILVVLGNPPYNGKSDNASLDSAGELTFIGELIEDYKSVDGQRIRDRGGLKWLQNDYVKFIRFAEWKVARSGEGVVAFITANSYLANQIHRGMRQHLLETFTDIYILNLHGHSNKKEQSPDGTQDVNVFDIQEGVTISVFIRRGSKGEHFASVRYADIHGTRKYKYDQLLASELTSLEWQELTPKAPYYLFVPQKEQDQIEYEQGWRLPDIFNQNGDPAPGLLTTQDELAIAMSSAEIKSKVKLLLKSENEEEARTHFRLCKQSQWNYAGAKSELNKANWEEQIVQVLYRPFDVRWTVYNTNVAVHRRDRVNRHMLIDNLGLGVTKNVETQDGFRHIFVTNKAFAHHAVSIKEVNYVFPLWLYPTETEAALGIEREANLAPAFVAKVKEHIGETPTPEDIFSYAYAVFHAPTYRTRYAAFLKTDFPRLPLPPDAETFHALAALGAKLTALHLLEAPELNAHGINFPVSGDHIVKKIKTAARYVLPTPGSNSGRVKLNDAEYFDNVPPEAWEFRVGGYQPAAKWLEDRAGRALTADDITHYRRMIAAMRETAALLPEVDAAFSELLAKNIEHMAKAPKEE